MRRAPGTEALKRAKHLRREMTPQEALLWAHLRGRRLDGFKFKRQEWVGPFIADFYCWEARLIVEADGSQHGGEEDARRDRYFAGCGFKVLRFWNNEISRELDAVLEAIRSVLHECVPSPSHPAPPGGSLPLPEGERGIRAEVSLSRSGRGKGPAAKPWEG